MRIPIFSISPETATGNPFMPSLHLPSSPLLQDTACRNTGVIPAVSANTHKIPVRITNNRSKTVVNHINNHRQLKLISTSIHDQATIRNNISRLPSFLLINARSLLPKIDELSLLISIHSIEFIAVTETWLNDTVPDQLIYINNYNIFRNDRSYSRGGVISTNIPAKRRMGLENPSHECLWIWLRPHRLPRHLTGLICCVLYNPPDTPVNEQKELTAYLIDQIDRVRCIHPDCGVVLLGDFNNLDISDLLRHHNLSQIVDTPTREGNILDLIVTNLEALYSKPVVLAPLGSSDHNIVKWSNKTNALKTDNKSIKKNIRSFPMSARVAFGRWCCSREWFSDAESINSATALASSFTNELNSAVDRLFPSKVIRIHNSDKPWMTPALKKLKKKAKSLPFR